MAQTIPARPTTYKGIKMRSRLEARFAQELDQQGVPWQYEPQCFADETGQYLPDFRLGTDTYIEIKGVVEDDRVVRRKMEIIWSSVPGAFLQIREASGRRWNGLLLGYGYLWELWDADDQLVYLDGRATP